MNKIYGFEGEVRSKLSETFVELFAEVFCCLPLAHVINEKIFVVHGGLFSVDGVKLSDIRAIDRFCEPPEEGMLCPTVKPVFLFSMCELLAEFLSYAIIIIINTRIITSFSRLIYIMMDLLRFDV